MAHDFIWASGIEDTFVPQARPGQRPLDEYQLMGHYDNWRKDVTLARELGLAALRWGVPWYRVEPLPGEFDWRWTDDVIPYMVEELGILPIIDLMHYGCPFWLRREFASDEYPQAVARYAAAFATRYRGLVRWYTPLNEPLVNALMCGRRGVWPPYLRGDGGFLTIMMQIIKGVVGTIEAIRSVDPSATIVQVEATGLNRAENDDLAALAVEETHRNYLSSDLLSGLVRRDHPLYTWLVRNGVRPADLTAIANAGVDVDIWGVNFYPQWSTQRIGIDTKGRLSYRATEQDGAGFAELIAGYHSRYHKPLMVTETSAFGSVDVRARWLETSVAAIRGLRELGVPVVGYTWFPLFTMIDWRYRTGKAPLDDYYLDLGLYTRGTTASGRPWQATPLVEQFAGYIRDSDAAVGALRSPSALSEIRDADLIIT